MRFPEWVDRHDDGSMRRDPDRARQRLKYLINAAATRTMPAVSIRNVAAKIGVDHSVIASSIRRGHFTHSTARLLEQTFGREVICSEDLVSPLKADAL